MAFIILDMLSLAVFLTEFSLFKVPHRNKYLLYILTHYNALQFPLFGTLLLY